MTFSNISKKRLDKLLNSYTPSLNKLLNRSLLYFLMKNLFVLYLYWKISFEDLFYIVY